MLEAFAATGATRLLSEDVWGDTDYEPPKNEADYTRHARRLVEIRNKYESTPIASVPERTQLRDKIVFNIVTMIKHYHEGTTDDVYEVTTHIETLFDIAGLTLNALGAVTGGAATKAAYNAAAGAVLGFRGSLNKNILAEQTKYAILTEAAALREKAHARLLTNLKQPDNAYGLEKALSDTYDFFQSGSVKYAVAELVAAAEKSKAVGIADKKLAEERKAQADRDRTELSMLTDIGAEAQMQVDAAAATIQRAQNQRSALRINDAQQTELTMLVARSNDLATGIESQLTKIVEGQVTVRMATQSLAEAKRLLTEKELEVSRKAEAEQEAAKAGLQTRRETVQTKQATLEQARVQLQLDAAIAGQIRTQAMIIEEKAKDFLKTVVR